MKPLLPLHVSPPGKSTAERKALYDDESFLTEVSRLPMQQTTA